MSVFLRFSDRSISLCAVGCECLFVRKSPLMIGVHLCADMVVLCVAGVKGGVASGEGGMDCSAGDVVVSNIVYFSFAQGGTGVEGML